MLGGYVSCHPHCSLHRVRNSCEHPAAEQNLPKPAISPAPPQSDLSTLHTAPFLFLFLFLPISQVSLYLDKAMPAFPSLLPQILGSYRNSTGFGTWRSVVSGSDDSSAYLCLKTLSLHPSCAHLNRPPPSASHPTCDRMVAGWMSVVDTLACRLPLPGA